MPTPKVNSWLGWRIFTVNRPAMVLSVKLLFICNDLHIVSFLDVISAMLMINVAACCHRHRTWYRSWRIRSKGMKDGQGYVAEATGDSNQWTYSGCGDHEKWRPWKPHVLYDGTLALDVESGAVWESTGGSHEEERQETIFQKCYVSRQDPCLLIDSSSVCFLSFSWPPFSSVRPCLRQLWRWGRPASVSSYALRGGAVLITY
jgi:hypothetical protein